MTSIFNKHLKELETAHANLLADTINSTDDTRRMYEASRVISGTKEAQPISVFIPEISDLAFNDKNKVKIVKDWFLDHYTGNEPPLVPFTGVPLAFNSPITACEVEKAAKRLKNGKAVGPDELPNEYLKYTPPSFFDKYASLVNESFEKHEHVQSFTEGFLTPLQKPGKPKGPVHSGAGPCNRLKNHFLESKLF
jgi:hypothetical protein